MTRKIVVAGIIKCEDEYLVVKRSASDDFFPGAWEYPGGKVEEDELILDALKRELKEEVNFDLDSEVKLIHFYDEIKYRNNESIHYVELCFLINVDSKNINVKLSDEHEDFKWVKKDSELLDEYIKEPIKDL